jgi:hypothetical protein
MDDTVRSVVAGILGINPPSLRAIRARLGHSRSSLGESVVGLAFVRFERFD